MKALFIVSILFSLGIATTDKKINEYCKIKADTFKHSERLYKHAFDSCKSKLLNKNISLSKINKMITDEDNSDLKRQKTQERINNSKKFKTKLKSIESVKYSRATTKGNPHFGCGSQAWLKNMNSFIKARDTNGMQKYLDAQKCIILKYGLKVTIKYQSSSIVKYTRDGYAGYDFWSNKDALNYIKKDTKIVSISNMSDKDMINNCKEGCSLIFQEGSTDYRSCVYSCTH